MSLYFFGKLTQFSQVVTVVDAAVGAAAEEVRMTVYISFSLPARNLLSLIGPD